MLEKHVSYDEMVSQKLQEQMQEERRMEIEMVNAREAASNVDEEEFRR